MQFLFVTYAPQGLKPSCILSLHFMYCNCYVTILELIFTFERNFITISKFYSCNEIELNYVVVIILTLQILVASMDRIAGKCNIYFDYGYFCKLFILQVLTCYDSFMLV